MKGNYNGELTKEDRGGCAAHLAPAFGQPEGGVWHRDSKEGYGDMVIANISRKGWSEILRVFDSLRVGATRAEIEDAIMRKLDWVTWDKPSSGR